MFYGEMKNHKEYSQSTASGELESFKNNNYLPELVLTSYQGTVVRLLNFDSQKRSVFIAISIF